MTAQPGNGRLGNNSPQPVRIPFDSLCLACSLHELERWIGARVQRIVQPDDLTIAFELYAKGEAWLVIGADPDFARLHLATRRPITSGEPPTFCMTLRAAFGNGRLVGARQRGLDRVADLTFSGEHGEVTLVAELMGKHANVMLVDQSGRVVSAMKWVGPGKSRRPILPGRPYTPPPFDLQPSLLEARPDDDLAQFEGASPFLRKLIASTPGGLEQVQSVLDQSLFEPVYSPGHGAYPISVASLGLPEVSRAAFGPALEQAAVEAIARRRLETLRHSLGSQLRRVVLAREVALADLEEARDTARRAGHLQLQGELILAYRGSLEPGQTQLEAWDYEGNPIAIPLRADLTPIENAQRFFSKAKKAKSGAAHVEEQIERLSGDLEALQGALMKVEATEDVGELESLHELATKRRWLHKAAQPVKKEDRPFQGKAVRELEAPGGWRVLYGDNAEANDYITVQLGRPNDWWLHVRGASGAHVLVPTQNKPDRVPPEVLRYAAEVAVRNSSAKHSGYVEVICTLKKYVRRPRGAPPGAVTYSHERTIVVGKS